MKQEVEVTIKLTLEVDTDVDKKGIKEIIKKLLPLPAGWLKNWIEESLPDRKYSIIKHKVISIKEEAQIYKNK
jgi:hypothetical protein